MLCSGTSGFTLYYKLKFINLFETYVFDTVDTVDTLLTQFVFVILVNKPTYLINRYWISPWWYYTQKYFTDTVTQWDFENLLFKFFIIYTTVDPTGLSLL